MKIISWNEFEQVELRAGTILTIEDFPEARKPAYIISADFGGGIGIKRSSALVAKRYADEVRSSNSRVSADNYGDDPYRMGYSDALKKVLTIIRECNGQEWCNETSSVNAILVDAIQAEMNGSKAQLRSAYPNAPTGNINDRRYLLSK